MIECNASLIPWESNNKWPGEANIPIGLKQFISNFSVFCINFAVRIQAMKTRQILNLLLAVNLALCMACSKENKSIPDSPGRLLDTLEVVHSIKGWEIYSWPDGTGWHYSILVGTNRLKTLEEVTSSVPSDLHLITVTGTDSLQLVLNKFPENEYLTWFGKGWLQSSWGSNFGNLQLPPTNIIDDVTQYCISKKLNLQVVD
jgi:hypothetical protein